MPNSVICNMPDSVISIAFRVQRLLQSFPSFCNPGYPGLSPKTEGSEQDIKETHARNLSCC